MLSQRRSQLVARLRQRKSRGREGLVLVEGVRAVEEALDAGAEVSFAVVSPRLEETSGGVALATRLRDFPADVHAVEDEALARLADTEHPQGVLLICRQPQSGTDVVGAEGRVLVLDGVQDPGNVGTLIRAAAAFALDAVVSLDGSADPWGAKAVRSSAGTVFRIPVLPMGAGEALTLFAERALPVWVADAGGRDVATVSGSAGWALVVGNEGAGARPAVRAAAAATLRIPMPGSVESLNAGVAGSILLYALTLETMGDP